MERGAARGQHTHLAVFGGVFCQCVRLRLLCLPVAAVYDLLMEALTPDTHTQSVTYTRMANWGARSGVGICKGGRRATATVCTLCGCRGVIGLKMHGLNGCLVIWLSCRTKRMPSVLLYCSAHIRLSGDTKTNDVEIYRDPPSTLAFFLRKHVLDSSEKAEEEPERETITPQSGREPVDGGAICRLLDIFKSMGSRSQ